MNKTFHMGRLTRDVENRQTTSGLSVSTFTLAVDRRFKDASGNKQVDFFPVTCWKQLADFCANNLHKGSKVIVVGSLQNRSWDDKDGNKRNVTEIIAEEVYFAESKSTSGNEPKQKTASDAFPDDGSSTSLPFDI